MISLLFIFALSFQTTLPEFFEMLSKKDSVVLVTKQNCPYCMYAKRDLKANGYSYKEIDIADSPKVISYIRSRYNYTTVPAIFYCGKFGQGYSNLKNVIDIARNNPIK